MKIKQGLSLYWLCSCVTTPRGASKPIILGAAQLDRYLPQLKGKKVALVVNQTSCIGGLHLVGVLRKKSIAVQKFFHLSMAFEGVMGAEEFVADTRDPGTSVEIISLYGKVKKPTQAMLADVDRVVFDM